MPTIPLRLSPGLPEGVRRSVVAALLCLVAAGLAWQAHVAGWPREQAIAGGILIATVLLWVTETLPLFATAFVSIAVQMVLLGNPGEWAWLRFDRGDGPSLRDVLNAAVDPVLLLFFGGLVLARAASKTGVDRTIAALVLRPMADSPARLLAGVMIVTACFSLWMSNTATTALMLAILAPILRQVPDAAPFRKALLLAVPVSANVAGMGTPIASPPNAIAMSYITRAGIDVSFGQWMLLALPIVIVLVAAAWWWLLRLYPAGAVSWRIDLPPAPLSRRGAWVAGVTVVTLVCWITEPWHGVPPPAVAALPVILFFATDVIARDDVNSLDWDVLILIAGGLTLGYTLQVTQLDGRLAAVVPAGASDAVRLVALAGTTLVFGTFFSNTAIASMMAPVAVAAAAGGAVAAAGSVVTAYVLTIALVASLSMALPMSTPPNAMAYASSALTSRDFLRTGGLVGLAGAAAIALAAAFLLHS